MNLQFEGFRMIFEYLICYIIRPRKELIYMGSNHQIVQTIIVLVMIIWARESNRRCIRVLHRYSATTVHQLIL
jgi:hypothetical protein